MRISESMRKVITDRVSEAAPGSDCFLFGSRVDDNRRGGDIDLLLLSPEKLTLSLIRRIRRMILDQIGEQKLDIVNFTRTSTHPFKEAALEHSVRL